MRVNPIIPDQQKVEKSNLRRQDILRKVAIAFISAIIYFIFIKIVIL